MQTEGHNKYQVCIVVTIRKVLGIDRLNKTFRTQNDFEEIKIMFYVLRAFLDKKREINQLINNFQNKQSQLIINVNIQIKITN